MAELAPWDVVTSPSRLAAVACYGLSAVPAEPAAQEDVLAALSPLPPAALSLQGGGEDSTVGACAIVEGTARFEYPPLGSGSYVLVGMALVYEGEDQTLLVTYQLFTAAVSLGLPGDYDIKAVTLTVARRAP